MQNAEAMEVVVLCDNGETVFFRIAPNGQV